MRNRNKLLFLILYIFINMFIYNSGIYAGGKKENTSNDSIMESNNAMIAIENSKNKTVYFAYRQNNELIIDYVEYFEEGKKFYYNIISNFKVYGINLVFEYKIKAINNEIFVYQNYNKTLFIVKLPEKDNISFNIIPKTLVNVEKAIFYDDTCFYLSSEGILHIYNKIRHEFYEYPDIRISDNFRYFEIMKTDKIAKLSRQKAEEWYVNWYNSFEKICNDENIKDLSDFMDENKLFRRYLEFKKYYIGNAYEINEKYSDFNEWYQNFYKFNREIINAKKEEFIKEFKNAWNISPEEQLFSSSFELPKRNTINNMKLLDLNSYNGKNGEVSFLINLYNEIIKAYAKLKNLSSSYDSIKLIEDNYNVIVQELERIYNEENMKIDIERKKYEENIMKLENEFSNSVSLSINSIGINYNTEQLKIEDFDYIFLPQNNDHPAYTIIKKTIYQYTENIEFSKIGQDTKLIGMHENYLFICDNEFSLYDPFTLEKIENIKYNNENERILFAIENENNIFITKTLKDNKYNIKSMNITNNSISFRNVGIRIYGNINRIPNSFETPFFTTIVNNNIYINTINRKQNNNSVISIIDNYIYREVPSGSGIIVPRR